MINYPYKCYLQYFCKFSKVAYLHFVPQLDIRRKKGTTVLSPKTDYVDYLVFKLGIKSCELEYSNSIIRFVNYESDTETEKQANTVKLVTSTKLRGDGWMEVELGYSIARKVVMVLSKQYCLR
ncbi:hypothetical protein MTR67_019384 [Solanum verrucosum]|uniref:Uncharacterized protein n=1 Tax=Solanum verrucosum TaxID=315347 RepID=A0AAF0QU72_SOLVR|nr:hypothetical protein MTR67_019384 [Solanum verrucosum]